MPKVIIHDAIDQAGLDVLARRSDLEIFEVERDDEERLRREIADADGLILRYLPLGTEALRASTRLKVVARHGVGCDNIDLETATAMKIPVATVGDANAVTVAELTLFFMLAAAKKSRHYDDSVRRGDFLVREAADHLELYGRTVLIIGFGRIGRRVAARCRAFEMTVECCDPYIPQQDIVDAGCTPVASLAEALPRAGLRHRARAAERRNTPFDRPDGARIDEAGRDLRQRGPRSDCRWQGPPRGARIGAFGRRGTRRFRRRAAATRRSPIAPSGHRTDAPHGRLVARRLYPHGDPMRAKTCSMRSTSVSIRPL